MKALRLATYDHFRPVRDIELLLPEQSLIFDESPSVNSKYRIGWYNSNEGANMDAKI